MTINEVAALLLKHDNYEIITHHYPDGDCLGCGYALCLALQQLGKHARVVNTDLPERFGFLAENVQEQDFEAEHVVSVDVADEKLLGCNQEKYTGKIFLVIDHHKSNCINAPHKYIDADAAAACEIIYEVVKALGAELTHDIVNSLYTGVSTDTGCFCYPNTTPRTMRIAAELMELGCDSAYINKVMFETKSKRRVQLEREILDKMIFCADDQCAIIYTTLEMVKGLTDDEIEGIASMPRQIEGVRMGITAREKADGTFKISVRTNGDVDACDFCRQFGGGGHAAAAGCTIKGSLETTLDALKAAVEKTL